LSVYIDLVFLINFLFDAEILYILIKIYQKKLVVWRLILGSLMGGIQGVLFFIPYFRLLSVSPIGIILPVIFVLIVLHPLKIGELVFAYIIFLVISFLFSGIIDFLGIKAIAGLLLVIPVYAILRLIKNKMKISRSDIKLYYGDKCVSANALYDSGNNTSYFGTPVIFASKKIFQQFFGEDFQNSVFLSDKKDICMVPYQTIDNTGIMFGIKLNKAVVKDKEYEKIVMAYFEKKINEDVILNVVMI